MLPSVRARGYFGLCGCAEACTPFPSAQCPISNVQYLIRWKASAQNPSSLALPLLLPPLESEQSTYCEAYAKPILHLQYAALLFLLDPLRPDPCLSAQLQLPLLLETGSEVPVPAAH